MIEPGVSEPTSMDVRHEIEQLPSGTAVLDIADRIAAGTDVISDSMFEDLTESVSLAAMKLFCTADQDGVPKADLNEVSAWVAQRMVGTGLSSKLSRLEFEVVVRIALGDVDLLNELDPDRVVQLYLVAAAQLFGRSGPPAPAS